MYKSQLASPQAGRTQRPPWIAADRDGRGTVALALVGTLSGRRTKRHYDGDGSAWQRFALRPLRAFRCRLADLAFGALDQPGDVAAVHDPDQHCEDGEEHGLRALAERPQRDR